MCHYIDRTITTVYCHINDGIYSKSYNGNDVISFAPQCLENYDRAAAQFFFDNPYFNEVLFRYNYEFVVLDKWGQVDKEIDIDIITTSEETAVEYLKMTYPQVNEFPKAKYIRKIEDFIINKGKEYGIKSIKEREEYEFRQEKIRKRYIEENSKEYKDKIKAEKLAKFYEQLREGNYPSSPFWSGWNLHCLKSAYMSGTVGKLLDAWGIEL